MLMCVAVRRQRRGKRAEVYPIGSFGDHPFARLQSRLDLGIARASDSKLQLTPLEGLAFGLHESDRNSLVIDDGAERDGEAMNFFSCRYGESAVETDSQTAFVVPHFQNKRHRAGGRIDNTADIHETGLGLNQS